MKRSALQRRTPLQRGGSSLRRTPLKRGPWRRKRADVPAEGPLDPATWRKTIFKLSNKLCILTGAQADDAHHVIPAQVLRRDGRFDLLWHPDNGVALSRLVHERHERAVRRIPREALPVRCIAFAERYGYLHLIERYYPVGVKPGGGDLSQREKGTIE